MCCFKLAIVLFLFIVHIEALDNGVALTPAMGWSSWNTFGNGINETIIREQAAALISSGLSSVGYIYVNIDDGWQNSARDAEGHLFPNPDKFPSGFESLTSYVHSLGLLIGIYSARGNTTCAGNPGSAYHEDIDAQLFALWGFDYVKYDSCKDNRIDISEFEQYRLMQVALNETGRTFYYSICQTIPVPLSPYGFYYSPMTFGPAIKTLTNAWLTERVNTADSFLGFVDNLDSIELLSVPAWSGPGSFNDADMLQVCRTGMTNVEYQAHFGLWATLGSPLILGNNLLDLVNNPECKDIISNKEVIDINQDSLGFQGVVVFQSDSKSIQIYGKPLSGVRGRMVVTLFNRLSSVVQTVTVNMRLLSTYPWPYDAERLKGVVMERKEEEVWGRSGTWSRRDVLRHVNKGEVQDGQFEVDVQPHSIEMYVLTPENQVKSS